MINFSELQIGDVIEVEYDGKKSEGEVIDLDHEDKEACVQTEVQDFWYTPDQLYAIPLSDEQLHEFGFERVDNADGTVKYKKDAFRILLSQKDNFSNFEMWYREDRRHMSKPIGVHELQNHFIQMTKIHLDKD
jgi:hypothetical protein